jgi:ribose transport system permease protein
VSATKRPRAMLARPAWLGDLTSRYGLVGIFVLEIVFFSILRPSTFPTSADAQAIASTNAVVGLLALGAMVPLVVGQFDVSVGFQLGLSQTLCAGLIINDGWPAQRRSSQYAPV